MRRMKSEGFVSGGGSVTDVFPVSLSGSPGTDRKWGFVLALRASARHGGPMASAGLRLGACARRLRGAAGAARAAGGRRGFPRAVVRGPHPGDSPSPTPALHALPNLRGRRRVFGV